ncbi:uncharacterized protein LOC116413786 [Galleria mellonella]|uniref:Uncharacterized protein LOC116413786 n=1 Tax=Galleria mellonella TaxID=7137 RepID=A0A6J3CF98_GALME|nr:uncharacterized protein LOC116413786 [Galleria mellonella]
MNTHRSDASTSTDDDMKERPLCLFYFTHPFGVLSPEPPTVTAAPAHVARAFINMEPVSPFHFWNTSTNESYNTATTVTSVPNEPSASTSKLKYDLGKTTVHKNPVNLVSVARTRKCTIDFGPGRDAVSSSLFSSDIWISSSSSSKSYEYTRRIIPYHRILPPLQLPPPKDASSWESSDDNTWPVKYINREKFSLPPIEMPTARDSEDIMRTKHVRAADSVSSVDSVSGKVKCRRRLGVKKHRKRVQLSGVRRMVTCLMRRTVRGILLHLHRY